MKTRPQSLLHRTVKLTRILLTMLVNSFAYLLFRCTPIKNQVLAQSYKGEGGIDSPDIVADQIERLRLAKVIRVAKSNHSEDQSSITVKFGSLRWVSAMAKSRVIIINNALPIFFIRRGRQVVIQTWHGTPFKKIGLDVSGPEAQGFGRGQTLLRASSRNWNIALSNSKYMNQIYKSAFGYLGPVLESGFPRNDPIPNEAVIRDSIRSSLGVRPEEKLALYAPTWRDMESEKFSPNQVGEAFIREMPAGWKLAVRGHQLDQTTFESPNLVDALKFPNIQELFLASDLLITDYSSVMFDYIMFGKPICFYVPDLRLYQEYRGTYFDLETQAPGPVFVNPIDLVRNLDSADSEANRLKRKSWQNQFVEFDLGHATKEVVVVITGALKN